MYTSRDLLLLRNFKLLLKNKKNLLESGQPKTSFRNINFFVLATLLSVNVTL